MKKNNFFRICLFFIISIIISFGSSFIITNYNVLKLSKEDRKLITIDDKKLEFNKSESGKYNINIKHDGFINKIIFNYESNSNFYMLINYTGLDYYKNETSKIKKDAINYRLNKSVTKINDNVSNINIEFANEDVFLLKNIQIDNRIEFNYYLFIYLFLGIIGIGLVFSYFKFNLFKGKIEYLFLTISFIIGFLLILLQPQTTSYSWDDQIHYSTMFRIYEFDKSTEWTKADQEMREVSPFLSIDTIEERRLQNEYLNNSNEIIKQEKNSPYITYNQVGYLIPGLALKLCSILKIPFVLKIFITKIFMLLSYLLLMFFAIKIIPRGKRILCVLGLIPSALFLSVQFAYDAVVIGCIALFIAQFINIMENKNIKLNMSQGLLLVVPIIVASFIKAIYIPLILLILFIPKEKFDGEKKSKIYKIGSILILLLILSTFVLPTITQTSSIGDLRGGNTSVSGQISYVIKNPISYIKILNDTAINSFVPKFISKSTFYTFGYINEIVNINMIEDYENSYYIILILLVFVVLTDSYKKVAKKEKKTENIIKISNLVLNLGIILLIWTSMYLAFTPVGETIINGVQNRYFIPLLFPMILILFTTDKIIYSFKQKNYDSLVMGIMFITLMVLLFNSYFLGFCN